MSTSSDAATKKKDAVWQEAGEEFYQESYPSGSQQPNNINPKRTSRHNIPLPSQTARRNSYALGRSKKRTYNRTGERETGTNAFTYSSTMAVGMTANDIQVSVMPDLADLSIPNERKRWEELQKIKSMPIPMAQKRELKAQLTTIPMLKLKGWKRLKWRQRRFFQAVSAGWTHRLRNFGFWQSSLRTIEVRCGTPIVNVFLFIKWALYLNIGISALIITFLIVPHLISGENTGQPEECPSDWNPEMSIEIVTNTTTGNRRTLAQCCRNSYLRNSTHSDVPLEESDVKLLPALEHMLDRHLFSPLFYGFYHSRHIDHPFPYNYALAYAIVTTGVLALSFMLMGPQIGHAIKELILAGEGEYYKYCNLVLAGWDHYTKDDAGAKFKRKVLRHEMKLALQTEKYQKQKSTRSKKQKWKLFFRRVFANILCVALQAVAGYVIFYAYDFASEDALNTKLNKTVIGYIPATIIAVVNLVLPSLFRTIGRLEDYSPSVQTTVFLLRTLFSRLLAIAFVGFKFHNSSYCEVKEGYCHACSVEDSKKKFREECWETIFAEQLYKIIIADLGLKVIMVFVVNYLRHLIGKCIPVKVFRRISKMKFDIGNHSLDIVYIQSLSWLGLYFAPFIPIVACIYCFTIFYMKKFTVLVTSTAVPDCYKTTRTATLFIATKLISFTAVTLAIGLVMGLENSKDCGPFRDYRYPWEAVEKQFIFDPPNPTVDAIIHNFKTPGIMTPIAIILFLVSYYYYAVAQANRHLVETLRHLLILEGHDKQYLFARLNTMRRQSEGSTLRTETATNG